MKALTQREILFLMGRGWTLKYAPFRFWLEKAGVKQTAHASSVYALLGRHRVARTPATLMATGGEESQYELCEKQEG